MFLWFLGTSLLTVFFVFTDPRFDYRLLLVGSVLPDLIDVPFGQARWAHSLTVAVGALALVMLATAGRKPIRRLLLGLPIGMLLHLVWDGAFASTRVFWWPFSGSWGDVRVMSLDRGWLNVPMEIAGAVMLWYSWGRFGLSDAERRRRFVRHGLLGDTRPPVV
ncbi:MAG: hypothetical protein H6513_11205 [Acidimicrobiaceae bacterium]|nr:hypothetical protein [Ilumatobacter sp.]MCB9381247.1 hypothetical protein [Acidimicrobiaceae bacterium]MCO5330132.1 hypothetical protein [Ilumatobacteraceae bacterium]